MIGGLVLVLLFNMTFLLRINRGFMALLLFIVYVGGIMVLFTYCLIITPLQFFKKKNCYGVLVVVMGGSSYIGRSIGLYEFYNILRVLIIIGLFLFITIITVVEMIDISAGSVRAE